MEIKLYEVYCGQRYIGVYKGMSKEDACKRAYMKTGSGSAYAGNAQHMYNAKEL